MNNIVTILSFSGRENGNCGNICSEIAQFYMQTNMHSYKIDRDSFPACGGCDYECLKQGLKCPVMTGEQTKIMDTLCGSDIVYFVIPNYCGYPCANYFAFNERTVGYFNRDTAKLERYMNIRKRFVIVSNSEGENFTEAMRQQTASEPDILYLKTGKYHKESIAGDLMTSEAAKADLRAFLMQEASL